MCERVIDAWQLAEASEGDLKREDTISGDISQ